MEFKELIAKRRSVRKFTDREVPREVVDRILAEALSAPSARNTRTTRFLVVDDPVLVARMAEMRDYGSAFMKGAPLAFVVLGDTSKSDLWRENAAISATVLQLACVDEGLASCWVHVNGRPRRKLGAEAEAFGITCPLITKADGTKFGKTESGNVWLDPRYTSPYKFYQFWLNVSDEDAKRYIKIFTLLDRETIDALIAEHDAAPHLRVLQKRLAEEITCMIHSREEYEKAVEASAILFGGATSEALHRLDEQTLLQVFEGVPQYRVARTELAAGIPFVDLCAEKSDIFASKGECRKLVQGGGVSLNKEKLADAMRPVTDADLIAGKYLLVQRGKKNYYLVIAE